jgi:tRNA(Ile2) C34 agmatinyltransferase TiaS
VRRAEFPDANSEHLDGAPPVCPNCRGPYQPCDEGYRCVTCGKRWRVADVLRENLSRPCAHTDRPGAARIVAGSAKKGAG